MTESENSGSWKSGQSGNPAGRPKGSKNVKPTSKMRATLNRICALEEDALSIIGESLKKQEQGKPAKVNKTQLDTAKFVIKVIESLNNTCLREEMAILGVKAKDLEGGNVLEENQQDNPKVEVLPSFSMDQLESDIRN